MRTFVRAGGGEAAADQRAQRAKRIRSVDPPNLTPDLKLTLSVGRYSLFLNTLDPAIVQVPSLLLDQQLISNGN